MTLNRLTLAAMAVVVTLFLLTVGAPHASADILYFTSDHSSSGLGNAPFGQVELTQTDTGVDVVAKLYDNNLWVKTGSGDNYALKFVGLQEDNKHQAIPYNGPLVAGNFTNLKSSAGVPLVLDGPGAYDGDGTGYFAFGIICPSCATGGNGGFGGTISFTVTNVALTTAELLAALEVENGKIQTAFVADILSGQTGNTGPVDATRGSVPDGGMTLMLLGGALFGIETLRRKLRA